MAQAAFDAGVTKIINCGARLDSSRRAVKIASEIPFCFAAIGVHPHHAEEFPDLSVIENELTKLIEKGKAGLHKIVAIGECGLDYHDYMAGDDGRVIDPPLRGKIKDAQTELLKLHLLLAQKFHLPLILHCRDAYSDLLNLLHELADRPGGLSLQGTIHCFQGTLSDLKQFLDLGFYIGYDGYITYAKNYEEIVKNTPINKILTETDTPWLTPVPFRGTRNEPKNIKIICEKIAEIKGLDFTEMDKITTENAKTLFEI